MERGINPYSSLCSCNNLSVIIEELKVVFAEATCFSATLHPTRRLGHTPITFNTRMSLYYCCIHLQCLKTSTSDGFVFRRCAIPFAPSGLFHQTLPKSWECTNLSINSQSQVLDSLLALYHKTSGILKIRKRFFQVPWDFNQYDHTWCRISCSVVFSIGAVALKSLHPLLELFAVRIQKKRCWLIF